MWKICLLLSLVGSAVTTTPKEESAPGFPVIPWPPKIADKLIFPFIPQIVIPIQQDKISLVLIDVHLEGIHTCAFPPGKYGWVTEFKCTNITLRTGFKAGGGIFDLPIVGRGTISLDLALDVALLSAISPGSKMPVIFDTFKFKIVGLNPGSDMTYLVNSFANSMALDFEQAIKIIISKLISSTVAIKCGAENIERLGEELWADDTVDNSTVQAVHREKTRSRENTMRCVEGVIAAKMEELEKYQRELHPTNPLLRLSKALGNGLEALFTLYTPQ